MFYEKDGLGQREESDFRVAISDLIRLLSRGLGNSMKQSQENASALTRRASDFKIHSFIFLQLATNLINKLMNRFLNVFDNKRAYSE